MIAIILLKVATSPSKMSSDTLSQDGKLSTLLIPSNEPPSKINCCQGAYVWKEDWENERESHKRNQRTLGEYKRVRSAKRKGRKEEGERMQVRKNGQAESKEGSIEVREKNE